MDDSKSFSIWLLLAILFARCSMSLDQNAFVIVTDAREVLGEGFIETPTF